MPPLMTRRHNLLAHEMGLGKSLIAVELINRLELKKVLVICKASIKTHWLRKLDEYLDNPWVYKAFAINRRIDVIPWNVDIIVVNYDLITHSHIFQQLKKFKFDLLICDEAHYLKNMDTKRTKAVLSRSGLVFNCDRTLMMTGTPVLNRPAELYPMLKVLAPKAIAPYNDWWSFAKRYCDAWQDGFGLNADGASHTDELNLKLREHYMIRRTWKDVEVQLPRRRYEMVFIDPDAAVNEKLRTIEQAERKDFKHQKLNTDVGGLATLRRETAEAKIDTCIEQIKEYVIASGKLVIFAYHHSIIERLTHELSGFGVCALTGHTSQNHRQIEIDSFINDPNRRVFLGQIQAAGEGIDGLQSVCHNILFVETSWVPAEISQAIARLWRLGQERSVLVRFLIWANSIEEHMLRTALDKVQTIQEIVK